MFVYKLSQKISTAVIKANALQVFVLSILSIYFNSPWPVMLLMIDFGLRAINKSKYSPIANISMKLIVPIFNVQGKSTSLSPKQFAASIGFTLSIFTLINFLIGLPLGFLSMMSILAFFSFLEAFFGFCAGCQIYGWLMRWNVIKEENCEDCKLDYSG